MDEYRQRKESFVSNLHGTTLWETGSIMVNICATYFLCQTIKSHFSWHRPSLKNYLLEYSLLVLPMVFVTTIFSSLSLLFPWILSFIALIVYVFLPSPPSSISVETTPSSSSYSRIIEIFRGQTFLVTNLCILAVDFPIFPRRYAKTENYGYSGMDLGVGLFAIAHGMVSAQARKKSTNWRDFLLENLILFLLGMIRFLSMKYFSYVEHVSEYGVHWNFFLTLCLMKSIGNLLYYLVQNAIVAFGSLLIFHQCLLLKYFDYETYLTSSSIARTNFIDANREGLFSLPGYVCLYLFGIVIGQRVIDAEQKRAFLSKYLFLWPILLLLTSLIDEASRKLCNFSYILSTSGLACLCLAGFSVIQWLFIQKNCSTESVLLRHVNQKGLDTFLFANVLTGIINLNVRTIDTSAPQALLILSIYTLIVTAFGYFSPSIIKLVMKFFKLTK